MTPVCLCEKIKEIRIMKYFLMPKQAFDNNDINTYQIVLLAVLNKFANSNGECFPSRRTIAECGGFSIATYNKYIPGLIVSGMVQKVSRCRQNFSQTSNLFRICRNKKDCFKVRSDIFKLGLSVRALCVYMCLCRYIAEDNCCRISQRIISTKCKMSLVSVIRAVKELKQAGLLETISQTNIYDNGNYVLLYRLTDGSCNKNVTRKRVGEKLPFANKAAANICRYSYVIEKRLNQQNIPLLKIYTPPINSTYPKKNTYIKYISEKNKHKNCKNMYQHLNFAFTMEKYCILCQIKI